MIEQIQKWVFQSWGRRKVKVRLGDLNFQGTASDGIYGEAKVREPTIDATNTITDGNHRLHALLEEHGPDHEIEINQLRFPYWLILMSAGFVEMLTWLFSKAKALYSKRG